MHMALNWSRKRQMFILGGAGLFALVLMGILTFFLLYKPPTCTDGKQNGDETGVDCGGSCAYVCNVTVEAPRVIFARTVATAGRTDAIAYIENRNQREEAKAAPYVIELFDESGTLISSREGVIDLPPRSIVPLYVPSFASGIAFTPRAFVSFGESMKWRIQTEAISEPTVSNVALLTGASPRVTATITNTSAISMGEREVVATVFDAEGLALAASRTVIQALAPRAEANAVFTWSEPFPGEAIRVEVRVIPVLR